MVDISIVNGDYKPTYNWGVPPCIVVPMKSAHKLAVSPKNKATGWNHVGYKAASPSPWHKALADILQYIGVLVIRQNTQHLSAGSDSRGYMAGNSTIDSIDGRLNVGKSN